MGDKINNPVGRGDQARSQFLELDGTTIYGAQHIHAILCIDPAMFENQLPSLMLFLSQLIEGAKGEGRSLDITVHIKGKDTPIKLMPVNEGIDDILSYLFDASLGLAGGTVLKGKKDAFSLKDLAELDQYEDSVQWPRGDANFREIVFVFEPEKFEFTEVPEDRDLVGVTFRSDRAAYPYEFVKVKVSSEAEALIGAFGPASPCTMQAKYAYLFGQYYQENGIPTLKRLLEARNLRPPFIFKHSLSEFMKHERQNPSGLVHDASLCSAEEALSTAISAYFWYDGSEMDPFLFFLGSVMGRPSLVLQSLMLFVDGENMPPKPEEVSALPSGFYEMLVELAKRGDERAGDKKAAAFFIHSTLSLFYQYAQHRVDGYNRVNNMPTPEATFVEYLKRLNALPSDFIEAFVGITTSKKLLAEGKHALRGMIGYNGKRPEFQKMFGLFVLKTFMTLAENFKLLGDEEKAKEVKEALSWCAGYIKDIIKGTNQNLDSFGIFLDVMYEALKDEPALKRKFTSALVSILTGIDQKDITHDHYFHYIVSYLHKKGVLDPGDAKRFIEWTLTFEDIEKGGKSLYGVVSTWVDMWGYLTEEDRAVLSEAISKKSPDLMDNIIKWNHFTQHELKQENGLEEDNGERQADITEEYTFKIRYDIGVPSDSMITGISSILDAGDLSKVVARIIDNEYVAENRPQYIYDAVRAAHHYKKGEEWLTFVCGLMFATPNSYKALDAVLLESRNDEDKRATLMAVHTGLVKHEDSWPAFYEEARDISGLLLMVKSVLNEDIDGLVEWFKTDKDYGIGPHISAYFTKGFKTKLITKVLTLAKDGSEKELFRDFSKAFFWNDSGLISEGYEPKIHDPLFLDLFKEMIAVPALKGEDIGRDNSDPVRDFIKVLFAGFAPRTQKGLIEDVIALLRLKGASEANYNNVLSLFHAALEGIDNATELLYTRPFFDAAFEGIGSEMLPSDHPTVKKFFDKWEQFIGEYDADTRCSVLADMLGRFPAALAVNNIDIEGLFKKVLNNGYGDQDPAIAFKLGAHIAENPYAPIAPKFFGSFLTAAAYAEMVKGFVLETSKEGYSLLKPKDIRGFLTATNFIFYSLYREDYFRFALEIMKRSDVPDHLISYFLFPMRNEYLSLIKLPMGEMAAQIGGFIMIAEFFEIAFEDEAVPAERKKYLYKCFKQIEADLADGFFSKIPQISDEIKGVKERFRHLEERFKANLVEGKY